MVKLKWRVTLVSGVIAVGVIYLVMISIISPSIDDGRIGDGLYKMGANSHLMAPRNLVDKSSWAISNITSADYQFHDEPVQGQKVRQFLFYLLRTQSFYQHSRVSRMISLIIDIKVIIVKVFWRS